VLAALLSEDKGFVLPTRVISDADGSKSSVVRPGFLGLIIIGAIASTVSWALYGPVATAVLMSTAASAASTPGTTLTFAGVGGAILVGVGGSKWISGQVDKTLLRTTASVVAGKKPADAEAALAITTAPPSEALRVAEGLEAA
jgi:hypothetical protein